MPATNEQVRNGKAFEYAIAYSYASFLQQKGLIVSLVENDPCAQARGYFDSFDDNSKAQF